MSNFRRRLMMSIKKENYTELEYLEATGTQYIDTEIKTKQSLRVECTFSCNQKYTILFGGRKSPNESSLTWGVNGANNNVNYAFVGFGGKTQQSNITVKTTDNNKHTIIISNDLYTIDGIKQNLPHRGTFTEFYNIYLFTWNTADVADSRYFKGKVYDFKIYDNNVLIRDMIPVLDKNGIACMYDKVNRKYYYNQGQGEFLYGVPIPKGFTYKEGTKDTGLVIQDEKGNEFIWVPATESTYVKDTSFPGRTPTVDDTLPNGITDETADVVKYGGFYIGRYEAGVPENQTTIDGKSPSTSNVEGIPVSKKDAIVWGAIDYTNAKANAENMISNEYVQTGLLTGTAWDTTCHFIEDSLSSINELASLKDSRYYGNYKDSESPANITGYGKKQVAGYSDKWIVKNIYDLAGNVWEWTSEVYSSGLIFRGGCFYEGGSNAPVSYRNGSNASKTVSNLGFRVRLYIK